MAIRADYFCWAVLGGIVITSLPSIATSSHTTKNTDTAKLVGNFEGFRACPYKDPVGVPTIGYGNTYYADGRKVKLSDPCLTQEQAKKLMESELDKTAQEVEKLARVPLTPNQKSALTSFAFNVGIPALRDSDLLYKLNTGDKDGAAQEFDHWIHGSRAQVLPGLVDRRAKEKDLFKK